MYDRDIESWGRSKGLTPIIAMVLLLMLAIAAGGILFAFSGKMQTAMQESVNKQALSQAEAAAMRLQIVSVYGDNTKFNILVKNTGSTNWNITKYATVMIDGVYKNIDLANSDCTTKLPEPDRVCTITLQGENLASYNGKRITVRVDAPGNSDSITCTVVEAGSGKYVCSEKT